MRFRVRQRQGRTPGAAEYLPALDAQTLPQPFDVGDQIPGGVVAQFGVRRRAPAATLVEQDDAISARVEESPALGVAARAGSAVQEHHRLAARIAALLVVERVQRRDLQRAGIVGLDLGVERTADVGHPPSVKGRPLAGKRRRQTRAADWLARSWRSPFGPSLRHVRPLAPHSNGAFCEGASSHPHEGGGMTRVFLALALRDIAARCSLRHPWLRSRTAPSAKAPVLILTTSQDKKRAARARYFVLVGAAGFEPTTSCPPGRCATR